MNPFEMVIAIVAITTIGSIIRAKHMGRGTGRDRSDNRFGMMGRRGWSGDSRSDAYDDEDSAETRRLKEEVQALKQRIQTLERIAVDKESTLSRQIDDLRDR